MVAIITYPYHRDRPGKVRSHGKRRPIICLARQLEKSMEEAAGD